MEFTLYIIPGLLLMLFIYAHFKNVNAYESFIRGCKEGAKYVYEIMPFVISMVLATTVFRHSGVLDTLTKWLSLENGLINVELFNLMVFKPISGMASTVVLNNIFETYGPDSFIGYFASIIQGSTDTTLYIITVYFGAVGIKNVRHSIKVGLLVDVITYIIGFIVVYLYFF